ncbi:MAG: hypothetical protein AAFN07_12700 [Pseudomonadota bacterium]
MKLSRMELSSDVVKVWKVLSILAQPADTQESLIREAIPNDDIRVFPHYLVGLVSYSAGFLEPLAELLETEEAVGICNAFQRVSSEFINGDQPYIEAAAASFRASDNVDKIRTYANAILESAGLFQNLPKRPIPITELLTDDLYPYYTLF